MELKPMILISFNVSIDRLLIAPLMELKPPNDLPLPRPPMTFNRTAYGIEIRRRWGDYGVS